jgi:Ulp1 family protease
MLTHKSIHKFFRRLAKKPRLKRLLSQKMSRSKKPLLP